MKNLLLFFLLQNLASASPIEEQLRALDILSATLSGNVSCETDIINGIETKDYPAVGRLRRLYSTPNNFNLPQTVELGVCTASKVGPRQILTAAHCVKQLGEGEFYDFNSTRLKVKAIHVHPRYQQISEKKVKGDYSEVDLAVIELDEDIPGPFMSVDFRQPSKGAAVEMVGFGFNQSGYEEDQSGKYKLVHSGGGVKRVGRNEIESVNGGIIRIAGRTENRNLLGWNKLLFGQVDLVDGSDASAAPGDSGGPLLLNGKVVGVTSSGLSGIGLSNKDGEYESQCTSLYTPENQVFLRRHIP